MVIQHKSTLSFRLLTVHDQNRNRTLTRERQVTILITEQPFILHWNETTLLNQILLFILYSMPFVCFSQLESLVDKLCSEEEQLPCSSQKYHT